MTMPPPNPGARLEEIRATIARDSERAEDLISDLLDLAIAAAPNRAACIEAVAIALAEFLFSHHPVETIRAVREWRKEGSNGGSPPNPTVRDLGCTVDATAVSDTWAALRNGHVSEYAEEAWLESRVVPRVERDLPGVYKLRLRRKHRPQRPGYDWFAVADRIGDVFVIRSIELSSRLGKNES